MTTGINLRPTGTPNEEAHKAYSLGLPTPQQASVPLRAYCYQRGFAAGFIHPEDDLSRLKVFIVPNWSIWNPAWTEPLEALVANGGVAKSHAR